MNSVESDNDRQILRDAARRKLARIGAGLSGAAIAILIVAAYWIVKSRSDLPPLSRERFDAALARWQANGPENYDIEISVSGPQAGTYRAEVRLGEATALFHDGVKLTRQRVFPTWSVPGMFGTIRRDLENVEAVESGTATESTPQLELRAQFHSEYGYPEEYHRHQWGTNVDVTWQVTEFLLIEPQ